MSSGSPGGFGAPATPGSGGNVGDYGSRPPVNGGRFDFDDGGTYCGGWEDGKAHGHGVCTGPKGQGEYSGSWHFGFEVSGVYTWPSGSTFEGQWQNGKRHGLGTEYRGRWTYRGEWTQGFKGRYGVRQATASSAKYEGTWANGLQDGYGSETYADGGTYQGQWLRGLRHGYGVRTSAPFGMASHFKPKAPLGSMASLKSESAADPTSERDRRMDDVRGGFVLKSRSDEPPARRSSLVEKSTNIKDSILKGLKLRKQRSTGDLDKKGNSTKIRSTGSSSSWMSNDSAQSHVTSGSHHTDSNASFVVEDEHMDTNVTETYMGEWKNDKRSGFGISERSDGLKYEGEWYNNKKYGYGVTTFKDGAREEGKYKNNVLITSQKKKHLFLMRSAKFRERIDAAVNAAQRASKIALQKADIAISRTATARSKGEQADIGATHAREDSGIARVTAKQFAPDFHQPGTETIAKSRALMQTGLLQQQQRADLANKIGGYRGKDDRMNPASGGGGRQDLGGDPSLYDGPPQSFHPSMHMTSSSSVPPSGSLAQYSNYPDTNLNQSTTNIPDRFDRNSLINQPIDTHPDSSQYSHQFQQQQQQSQYRQPYMNNSRSASVEPMRGGDRGDGGPYNYNNAVPAGRRPYGQHLHDNQVGGGGDLNKDSMMMGNSIGHGVGGGGGASQYGASSYNTSGAGNANALHRNSMMMDSSMQHQHQQQQQMQHQPYGTTNMNAMMDTTGEHDMMNQRVGRDPVRRAHVQRPNNPNPSSYNYQQAMSDHFDHYNRAPSLSRDASMDRFHSRGRSATRARTPEVGPNPTYSRASSRQRTPFMESQNVMSSGRTTSNVNIDNLIDPSLMRTRGETPGRTSGKESPIVGPGVSESGSVFSGGPVDELILRQKGLGQEIPPLPYTPKRTESLFLKTTPLGGGGGGGSPLGTPSKLPGAAGGGGGGGFGGPIKRKKSLPDANSLPMATPGMSREEVSYLGSARRQEVRRQQDEAERLRANPFLYLLNPNIRNWFSRQRLIVLVFFINVSLAIMFLQLLT